jgi:hypothetical protein
MTDTHREHGDDRRLRKIFSSLPRVKAPDDFEGRVRRKIVSRPEGFHPVRRRFSAFAIPALSLMVIGTLSFLIYQTRLEREEDAPLTPREATTPDAPVTSPQAPFPAQQKGGREPARTLPGVEGRSDNLLKEKGAGVTAPTPPDAKKTDEARSFRGKAIPGAMKAESGTLPTGYRVADSLSLRDTVAIDSAGVADDSLRTAVDSTGGLPVRDGGGADPPHR